jgi:hypothetical protein
MINDAVYVYPKGHKYFNCVYWEKVRCIGNLYKLVCISPGGNHYPISIPISSRIYYYLCSEYSGKERLSKIFDRIEHMTEDEANKIELMINLQ